MSLEEAADMLYYAKNWGCGGNSKLHQALELAIDSLNEIAQISEALCSITEKECSSYGFDNECNLAEKWTDLLKN